MTLAEIQAGSMRRTSAARSARYRSESGSTEPMESDTPWRTTGTSRRTVSSTAIGRPPGAMKFSLMASSQSTGGGSER